MASKGKEEKGAPRGALNAPHSVRRFFYSALDSLQNTWNRPVL